MPDRPVITIDPAVAWGRPHIRGAPTYAIAGAVWAGDSVTTVADDYGRSRAEVLLACWWEASADANNRKLRKAWRQWHDQHAAPVLSGFDKTRTTDQLPDPPSRDEVT